LSSSTWRATDAPTAQQTRRKRAAKAPQQRSKKCRKGAEIRNICRCTAPRCRLRPAVFPRSAWGPGVLKCTSCSLNRDQQGHDQGTGSLPRQATGIRGHRVSAQKSICRRWSCRSPGVRQPKRSCALRAAASPHRCRACRPPDAVQPREDRATPRKEARSAPPSWRGLLR